MTDSASNQNLDPPTGARAGASARPSKWLSWRAFGGVVLVIVSGVLYWITLDNGLQTSELVGGDLITHQYAQVQARPSNAPGYPLYTMGGWLWFHSLRTVLQAATREPPNPVPILSSYSAVWALLALWLLYEIICTVTQSKSWARGNWPVALLVAGFYAVTYFFWYYATTTEQYSSAIAQTLGIVLVLIMWLRRRDSLGLLYLLAFLCGLSLAHMLTVALIVPPVVAAVIWANPRLLRSAEAIVGSVVAALLPLVSYAFVYVRGSQHPEWWGSQTYASAGEWFWSFVSTAQGREELMWAFEPGRPFFGNGFPELIGQELTWIIVVAGLVGIALLRRPLPFVLYVTLLLYTVFSWAYRFGNWFQVILPAYALVLIGVGAMADRWQRWIVLRYGQSTDASGSRRLLPGLLMAAPLILLGVAIGWRFSASYEGANSRNRPADDAFDRAAVYLSAPLPHGSALFAPVEDALALQYLADIWGVRPDIRVVSSDEAGALIAEQPVFATWDAAATLEEELSGKETLSANVVSPDWIAIRTPAQSAEDTGLQIPEALTVEAAHRITPEITLASYAMRPAPDGAPVLHTRQPAIDLTLRWQLPQGRWPEDVAISVRPTLDGQFLQTPVDAGNGVVQIDHALPAQLLLAGEPSAPDELLVDPYRVPLPAEGAVPGTGIAVILYRPVAGGFEDISRIDLPLPTALEEE